MPTSNAFPKFKANFLFFGLAISMVAILVLLFTFIRDESQIGNSFYDIAKLKREKLQILYSLENLQNQDQYKINKDLENQIKNIETTYTEAVNSYEKLLDLKNYLKSTTSLDELFTKSLVLLSQRQFATASATLKNLNDLIVKEKDKFTSSFAIPASVPVDNTAPASGNKTQQVQVDGQSFLVQIIAADLNSTRVIVDTASSEDCRDNCPVLSLADYVSRSGAYAGVNGSYFCPSTYPSCSGKTNSFDTLLMNKDKKYFNSDNNVYSTIPAVIVSGTSVRYVNQSLEWGRDTGVDAVIANYPLLLSDGNVVTGEGDSKQSGKGSRSFIGSSGTTIYIGVVFNASIYEAANVLKNLGLKFALNLDDGGSTALWFNGYISGPGRSIPNAILFIRK